MIKVGLTGGFGSGKSMVSAFLQEQGYPIIDADLIARKLVTPPSPVLDQIGATFGADLIQSDGQLDRRALGRHVFQNESARQQLNELILPPIRTEIADQLKATEDAGQSLVIVDAPTLFESSLQATMDMIVVVWAPDEVCRQRLKEFRKFSDEEITERLAAQIPLIEKKERADYVIDNSGSIRSSQEQALKIISGLLA